MRGEGRLDPKSGLNKTFQYFRPVSTATEITMQGYLAVGQEERGNPIEESLEVDNGWLGRIGRIVSGESHLSRD